MARKALVAAAIGLLACKPGEPTRSADRDNAAGPANAPVVEPVAAPAPLLWRVERDGATSYLFGTMHIGVSPDSELSPLVYARLDAARVFVMETDTSAVDPNAALDMARGADPPLDQRLSPAQWDALTELLPGVPPELVATVEPWFALLWATNRLAPPADAPMDEVLAARARDAEKTIVALEPWRYQLEVLAEVVDVSDLEHVVDDTDRARDELSRLADAYRAGDVAAIETIVFDPDEYARNPGLVDVVLTRRNLEWLPELERRLVAGNAFIAVGAGHLLGDRGLIALLRGRGYAVSRVSSSGTSAGTGSGLPASASPR